MSVMEKGAEDFVTTLRKMPKPIKALKPFKKAEDVVPPSRARCRSSRTSSRRRCASGTGSSSATTGITFDMNPKTFTLDKLFEMQLDRYEAEINDICSGALKELTIENGINNIDYTWRVTRFEVIKYMKGTQERGLILRSTEEIQPTLEDQMMNLSSMMSSRFVAPFLELTQKWEKLMSNIAETIEVWMKVQSKWMYLEAIFVGSEDIRLQLPEEAKRFDRIHSSFKKIMSDTQKNSNVLDACSAEGRLPTLQGLCTARGVPEEPLRLPRDEAHRLSALLLPLGRRAAADPRHVRPDRRAGAHAQALRQHGAAHLRPLGRQGARHGLVGEGGLPAAHAAGDRGRRRGLARHGREGDDRHAARALQGGHLLLPVARRVEWLREARRSA